MKREPRGIRACNPGNIREDPKDKTQWLGERATDDDPIFEEFIDPEHGIRALAKTLLTYQRKHKLYNVEQLISRWAPPKENNTVAYIRSVAKWTGFATNKRLTLTRKDHMLPLVEAIIRHENGAGPLPGGRWYSNGVVEKGLQLAGVK